MVSGARGLGTPSNTRGRASERRTKKNFLFLIRLAQFVAFFSLSMVLVSTITFVLATIEELQEDEEGKSDFPIIVAIIHLIDNFVIIFFTVEYILRLLICPVKKKFVKDTMNMVDCRPSLSLYLTLMLVSRSTSWPFAPSTSTCCLRVWKTSRSLERSE